MIARVALIVIWLLAGHAAIAGLYWALLHVPESTGWMLALSALLVLVTAALAAAVHAGAAGAWQQALQPRQGLTAGLRRLAWVLPAALVFALGWWLTAWLDARHLSARGAIDAAFMAQTGSPDTAWIHRVIEYGVFALRWGVALSVSVALLVAGLFGGTRGVTAGRWLRRGLAPVTVLATLGCVLVFVWLPWRAAYWRPTGIPPGVEPAFVAAKLGMLAVIAATGWAFILGFAAHRTAPEPPPSSSVARLPTT